MPTTKPPKPQSPSAPAPKAKPVQSEPEVPASTEPTDAQIIAVLELPKERLQEVRKMILDKGRAAERQRKQERVETYKRYSELLASGVPKSEAIKMENYRA